MTRFTLVVLCMLPACGEGPAPKIKLTLTNPTPVYQGENLTIKADHGKWPMLPVLFHRRVPDLQSDRVASRADKNFKRVSGVGQPGRDSGLRSIFRALGRTSKLRSDLRFVSSTHNKDVRFLQPCDCQHQPPLPTLEWWRSRLGWNRWTDLEADEESFHHVGILQHRDDAHAAATTWTGQHIDHEDPPHQLGPGQDTAPLSTGGLSRRFPFTARWSWI